MASKTLPRLSAPLSMAGYSLFVFFRFWRLFLCCLCYGWVIRFSVANSTVGNHYHPMAYEFRAERRVEFSETDAAGIVHFSNFFRYMEHAEHAFIRSLGFSVMLKDHQPPLGFPRVHASCDYKSPLRFEDQVEILLLVREKKPKALSYGFKFRNLSARAKPEVARGSLTVVCVAHHSNGHLVSAPIPPELARSIEIAPKDLLE